jgi:hypothetical protein
MRIHVDGEGELALVFEATALTADNTIATDERTVIAACRGWLLTGEKYVDPYDLADPFPDRRQAIDVAIVQRIARAARAALDGPDVARARAAQSLISRNPRALARRADETHSGPE